MAPARRDIRIDLGPRSYTVGIGTSLLAELGRMIAAFAPVGCRVFVVADSALPPQTVEAATLSLSASGFRPTVRPCIATEDRKSIDSLARLLGEMTHVQLERVEPVVALGGGVVGDLAGFAAAVYRRGIPVVQCPTTLLAMVDASVGGKTGINLDLGGGDLKKNMMGAFHQPRAVLADTATLSSLSDRQFRSGLAECLKHGLLGASLGDPVLWGWTLAEMPRILARDQGVLPELIARNVAVKAAAVGPDEREDSPGQTRALLNLGHTFGHAIETLPNLSAEGCLLHGEAVGLGLVSAATTAEVLGSSELVHPIRSALEAAGLPTKVRNLPDTDTVLKLMSHDKKVVGGRLRLVLPTTLGSARVVVDPPVAAVRAGVDAIRVTG
jgi:3-dehydroquinate synthetase